MSEYPYIWAKLVRTVHSPLSQTGSYDGFYFPSSSVFPHLWRLRSRFLSHRLLRLCPLFGTLAPWSSCLYCGFWRLEVVSNNNGFHCLVLLVTSDTRYLKTLHRPKVFPSTLITLSPCSLFYARRYLALLMLACVVLVPPHHASGSGSSLYTLFYFLPWSLNHLHTALKMVSPELVVWFLIDSSRARLNSNVEFTSPCRGPWLTVNSLDNPRCTLTTHFECFNVILANLIIFFWYAKDTHILEECLHSLNHTLAWNSRTMSVNLHCVCRTFPRLPFELSKYG